MIRVLPALLAIWLASTTVALAGQKVAIFPFELIDVSLQGEYSGPRADEANRLLLVTEELRTLAARDAGYDVVDLSALKPEIDRAAPFHRCDGCEADIARQAGADVAMTGTVRKISNLVLVVHLYVRDVASGKVGKVHRVELRGNTDETWLRGVRRLIREHASGR